MFLNHWCTSITINRPVAGKIIFPLQPPNHGGLKLNFDVSSKGNPGPIGFGCVVRGCGSHITRVLGGPLAFSWGFRNLKKWGFIMVLLWGDSVVVIGWELGRVIGSWKLSHLVYEIRELATLIGISFVYIPHDQNVLADKIANLGLGLESIVVDSSILEGCL